MRDRQTCSDCGKMSPETETNYTLISAQFGWRLTRRRTDSGDLVVEWRCAECWRDHKKKNEIEEPGSPAARAPSPPAPQPKPKLERPRGGFAPLPPKVIPSATTAGRSSRPPPRASSKPPPAGSPAGPSSPRKRP